MTTNVGLLLKDILLKTFFDFAMFEILPVTGSLEQEPKAPTVFSITIQDPEKFRLSFYLPNEVQKRIVENIFEKPITELSKEQINDCMMEIVNIVAGNFFTAYFKEETTFKMGLPHIYHNTKKHNESICSLYFIMDDELFKIELL